MNTKSYTIVITADGFTIMETSAVWRVAPNGNHSVAAMEVRNVETLSFAHGNRYEDAEERLRGWYRVAALATEASAKS